MAKTLPRSPHLLAAFVMLAPAAATAAVVVDGHLDADYGPALSTQTTQTSFVDTNPAFSPNPTLYADGSELDAGYGFISNGVLYLFLAGNNGFCCPTMFSHQEEFDVFIDSKTGGQGTLRADNTGAPLNALASLTFDTGFVPDYWVECTVNMACAYAELLASGGGVGYDLGFNTAGAPGTLSGGTNPFSILAAVDNSNGAGETQGCGAGSGAGVATGVEWAIPLGAIGDPAGCVTVSVLVSKAGQGVLGNQTLGPLAPGTCALGAAAGVDLSSLAGAQFFTVCPGVTPTRDATWGRLKTIYR